MISKQHLFNLYKKFFEQRNVLEGAPRLTMDMDTLTPTEIDFQLAEAEVAALVSYLLGVPDVRQMEVKEIVSIINKGYADQPFWKDLLLSHLDFVNEKNAEKLRLKADELQKEAYRVYNEVRQEEHRRRTLVKTYADVIHKENFAIDAERLMTSYFSMYRKDSKKAWETLTTNPGYFSPIITTDTNGHTILTPEEALAENKKIAKFLKSLRV